MAVQNPIISKDDCKRVVEGLIEALVNSGLGDETSLLVYGSYFGKWRNGLSDLDAMLYFSGKPPLDLSLRRRLNLLLTEIRFLYERLLFLKRTQFLLDVFILDAFHAADGRFIMFDQDFLKIFGTQTDRGFLHGRDFLADLRPVSLRNQNEFELMIGLHKLRNYLFFEIPRSEEEMFFGHALEALKFFKVLPRVVTIIHGEPMDKNPECLKTLRDYFGDIDYEPLIELKKETESRGSLEHFLRRWHKPEDETFMKCLECFELTLVALVKYGPMRSVC